jgi:hypothetical protein
MLGTEASELNRLSSTAAVVLTFVLAQPAIGNAAEIQVWTARAIATVLAEIGSMEPAL